MARPPQNDDPQRNDHRAEFSGLVCRLRAEISRVERLAREYGEPDRLAAAFETWLDTSLLIIQSIGRIKNGVRL